MTGFIQRCVRNVNGTRAPGMDERDTQARPLASDDLPPHGHLCRAGEADGQRVPRGIGIGCAERGEPGGVTCQHSHEIGIHGQRSEYGLSRPIDEPPLHRDRLDGAQRVGPGEAGLDPLLQAADERMEPVGQERDQRGP